MSYYPYYHCKSTCGIRFKADLVNRLFERHFKQFVPKPGIAELFTEIVSDAYTKGGGRWQSDQSRIMEIIADQNKRLTKSMELLLDEVITASEYKKIKGECGNTIAKCEVELKKLNQQDEEKLNIPGLAALAVENLKKLSDFYANADSDIKRAIIGSIYQEKWVFDGETHRTPEVNEAALLIYYINKRLRHKKTGVKKSDFFHSGEVLLNGPKLKKFYDDLKKIAGLEEVFNQEPLSRDFKLKYRRPSNNKKD